TGALDDGHHGDWLPVSQLTSLALTNGHPTNYLPLLRRAVNLVNLYVVAGCPPESPQDDIELPRLETVVLDMDSGPHDSVRMLDIFTLPALHTLQVSGGLLGHDPISSLTTFISRAGCKLQRIFLMKSCEISVESLHAAFPAIPEIAFDDTYEYWY
ncbi:hypothetical protein FB45DRAFT_899556, partial [Roridomyces roridus]